MIPYYIFLAIVMLFAYISKRNNYNTFTLFWVLLAMVLFAGLRSSSVGTDAGGYARGFENNTRTMEDTGWDALKAEPGIYILTKFIKLFSKEYVVFFIGVALTCYLCVLNAIKQNTGKIMVALFVFICLGLYTFVFNAFRQGLAVGVYMLSFKYLYQDGKQSFYKYCGVVLLAALFHRTVIVALPLYFLFRLKYSPKMLALVSVMGLAMGAMLPSFFSAAESIDSKYAMYAESTGGAEMLTLFYILITAFFIFWRSNVDDCYRRKYDVFLNMMLFGTLIYVIVQVEGIYVEMTRFASYFLVASIFLWSYIYDSEKKPKSISSLAIILGHLIYFYIFCSQMAGLTPYRLNENIFG